MKAYTLVLVVAIVAVAFGYADAALNLFGIVNLKKIWLERPYNGPEVVVEVVGVDMNREANRLFDKWSRPDTFVNIEHGRVERKTQVEGNTCQPRFLWKAKMPHYKSLGMRFIVMEANVLKDNEVIGRAYIGAERIDHMLSASKPKPELLSLGENIGNISVALTHPPKNLTKSETVGMFPMMTSTVTPLDMA
mmetsp:Transcript_32783/g.69177  ORF Transcript_32783/g.69177 Transcript_32783/m.69177 type:complete len:192 (-) Transcript_32783:247-822(-)|eukprot:CAMPEP_0183727506 /NCGR_PEP_ID=MMETSP0737-20130205/25747_1 /TAXON_ID=385413 /ORGANISM="Thalassiosira miniscula, Strain CCMP1093" /LENGTH=191 /DNA_ID=CAMNT_0025959159 /DNA_START=73 /DNA_END=648 /DNA_ORIENTATION=-